MGAFVNAETKVATFFRPRIVALAGSEAKSVTQVPNPRPAVFIRSWRTGGAAVNRRLDSPIMTMQVWHQSKEEAGDLAGFLRDYFYGSWGRRMQEVSGLYYDPDPASEADRYTWSTQLWLPSHI